MKRLLCSIVAVFSSLALVTFAWHNTPQTGRAVFATPTATAIRKPDAGLLQKRQAWHGKTDTPGYRDLGAGSVLAQGTYAPYGTSNGATAYTNGFCTVEFTGSGNEGWNLIDPSGGGRVLYNNPADSTTFPLTGWGYLNGALPPPAFSVVADNLLVSRHRFNAQSTATPIAMNPAAKRRKHMES
jgi:hypothetical protein